MPPDVRAKLAQKWLRLVETKRYVAAATLASRYREVFDAAITIDTIKEWAVWQSANPPNDA